MTESATKKDIDVAVEELAGMVQRSFTHVEKNMATKEDILSLEKRLTSVEKRMATKDDLAELGNELRKDMSHLEDHIDAKLDKIIDRFDIVIESHENRITALERQR